MSLSLMGLQNGIFNLGAMNIQSVWSQIPSRMQTIRMT